MSYRKTCYCHNLMTLSEDEFLWHCTYCRREVFAPRVFYSHLKRQALEGILVTEGWPEYLSPIVARVLQRWGQ